MNYDAVIVKSKMTKKRKNLIPHRSERANIKQLPLTKWDGSVSSDVIEPCDGHKVNYAFAFY